MDALKSSFNYRALREAILTSQARQLQVLERKSLSEKVNILNISIDNFSVEEFLGRLQQGVVFTPNVDHLMSLQKDSEFLEAYQKADFKVCDSQILMYAAKFLGTPIKAKISGSDLFPLFCEHHKDNENIKIFLLGGASGVPQRAQKRINQRIGRRIIVQAHSPSFGFEQNPEECRNIIRMVRQSGANVLVVGVGAPKQEKWIVKYRDQLPNIDIFLAVGAAIDFEAGNKPRAPEILSILGLEWLYRLMSEPRRLWKRYLLNDMPFLWLLLRQKMFMMQKLAMEPTSSPLWQNVVQTTEQALESGALQPISTHSQSVSDAGIAFCVRVLDSLVRKEAAQEKRKTQNSDRPFNPFLPYEEALFVADLSATHVCLLNKFNVVDHHILIVTREYEAQDSWLTLADFEALAQGLLAIEGLGFYNGGTQAGASQHHKHLQLVPLRTEQGSQVLPIADAINQPHWASDSPLLLTTLPFVQGVQTLEATCWTQKPRDIAETLLAGYRRLLEAVGVDLSTPEPRTPYNLLVTREWMMVVPRSQESYEGISVNSLGYAGWLLVKTPEDLQKLKHIGPMHLLTQVGHPNPHFP